MTNKTLLLAHPPCLPLCNLFLCVSRTDQIYVASKKLRKGGKNLGKRSLCAAIGFMAIFIPVLLTLRVWKQYFLSNLVVALCAVSMIILYQGSAAKIKAALPGASGQRISTLARHVTVCVVGILVANIAYIISPVIVPELDFVPNVILSVIIMNFFQPLAYVEPRRKLCTVNHSEYC